MPRWLPGVLARVHALVARRAVRFTKKAADELGRIGLGLDLDDAFDILGSLGPEDWSGRLRSELTAKWMYAFKPQVAGRLVYVKIVLRDECVVVSFHEENEDEEGDEENKG